MAGMSNDEVEGRANSDEFVGAWEHGRRRQHWCFMRFTTLPRAYDVPGVYMHRLQLIETPWFSVRLHLIRFPDEDLHTHDHPFGFLSFVLWGWYDEARPGKPWRRIRWFNRCPAEGSHKILRISARNVVTLVFTTGRKRRWGYAMPDEWVHWREYKKMQQEGLV